MGRGELTDTAWARIEPLLPSDQGRRGDRSRDHQLVINGILWRLRTGGADNTLSAYLAYLCHDTDWPEDLATYLSDVETDRKRYPLYGAAAANINPCAFWPTAGHGTEAVPGFRDGP